jgi:hypothetical protein
MFNALSSLTGGGGLSFSNETSATSGAESVFNDAFTYKSGGDNDGINLQTVSIVAVVAVGVYLLARRGR